MSEVKPTIEKPKQIKVLHRNPRLTKKQIRQRTKELGTIDLIEETDKIVGLAIKSLNNASDEIVNVNYVQADILHTVAGLLVTANDKKNKELIRLRRNLVRERNRRELSTHSLSEKLRSKAAEVRVLRERVKSQKEELKSRSELVVNLEELSTA